MLIQLAQLSCKYLTYISFEQDFICIEIEERYNNRANGISFLFYTNGRIHFETYEHGVRHGPVITYNVNGSLYYKSNYVNGLEHGRFIEFKNGKSKIEGERANGTIHGDLIIYSTSGELEVTETYHYGVLDGTMTVFYPGGVVKSRTMFKMGKLHGLCQEYNTSGVLMKSSTYIMGLLHGCQYEYYRSGKLKSKTMYRYDKMDGLHQVYVSNGTLLIEKEFSDGKNNGWTSTYDVRGRIISRKHYYMSEPNGEQLNYYESGNIKSKRIIFNKITVSYEYYYPSGAIKVKWSDDGQIIKYRGLFIRGKK